MKTTLNLKTLHGKKTECTMVAEGVKVTGMMVVCCHFQSYTQEGRYQLTRKKLQPFAKIKEWKHLRSISNEIVQRGYVQVGLLIGANCMKALEPTKTIHSIGGSPYAYKTRLG